MRTLVALALAVASVSAVSIVSACTKKAGGGHAALSGYAGYDEKADGAKQIADAEAVAVKSNKRVLVVFGGNWCQWCRALDRLFHEDKKIAAVLDKSYVVVHVDSDHNVKLNEKYKNPFVNGFPVILVLDGSDDLLHTQETGSLEKADHRVGHDPDKVYAFLKEWAPPA